jgi:magnesium transporter
VGPELKRYFRDVLDHVRLVNDEVAAQRDLLTTVLEANIAVISVEQTRISVRQTEEMRRLTMIATVFLPLSFVVGFFGQNFGWLTEHMTSFEAFLVLGGGGLVIPLIVLVVLFRRGDAGATTPRQPS